MPELRKGVRRGRPRAPTLAAAIPTNAAGHNTRVRTRAAIAREEATAAVEGERPRTRLAAKRLKQKQTRQDEGEEKKREDKVDKEQQQQQQQVIVISERDTEFERRKADEEEKGGRRIGKMGDDSGGLSANKAVGQEEEGSTAPFPERVSQTLSYCW